MKRTRNRRQWASWRGTGLKGVEGVLLNTVLRKDGSPEQRLEAA